jgi:uncharacterized protein (DUF1501 family)
MRTNPYLFKLEASVSRPNLKSAPDSAGRPGCPLQTRKEKYMNYRRLGRSGLQVSELSIGSWVTYGNQVDHHAARESLAAARDHGVNFFDNAEVYAKGKSEEIMGPRA